MKNFRELFFEPLEKRELYASDFGNHAIASCQLELDSLNFGDFRNEAASQSQSQLVSNRGHHYQEPILPGIAFIFPSKNTKHVSSGNALVNFGSTVARLPVSQAEGESSPVVRPILTRPAPLPEATLSIVFLIDRPLSKPTANAVTSSNAIERIDPNLSSSLNSPTSLSTSRSSPQSVVPLAPKVEIQSRLDFNRNESLRSFSDSDFRHSDLAFIELGSDEVGMPQETNQSHLARTSIKLNVPVPTGMIDVGLDVGLQASHRNSKDARSIKKHRVDPLDSIIYSRESIGERPLSAEGIAITDGSLPIPSGMIYLDFVSSLHSKSEAALMNQPPMLQAGINPLALVQAFVNSQPVRPSAVHQENDLNEVEKEVAAESRTMSWSSVGMAATLSGIFFAIANRWGAKAVIAKPVQKLKRSLFRSR